MIIDTHVHVCPDRIVQMMEDALMRTWGSPTFGRLTAESLLSTLEEWGIDKAVVFNVCQDASQVRAANNFLIKLKSNEKLIPLGNMLPGFPEYKEELKRLRDNGIQGIKFSSRAQKFVADDPSMFRIYEEMNTHRMIAYFHSGDPIMPTRAGSDPAKLARVADAFPKMKIVVAHLGGLDMLEEAQTYLVGKNVYLDTAWVPSLELLDPDLIVDIFTRHGINKILFGTDSPGTYGPREIRWVKKLPLKEQDKERILFENARELFGIK